LVSSGLIWQLVLRINQVRTGLSLSSILLICFIDQFKIFRFQDTAIPDETADTTGGICAAAKSKKIYFIAGLII
jgi:hypothetical protein